MSRWLVTFSVLAMLSALAVVFVTQASRESFFALQTARQDRDELQVHWERLALEQSTLADHGRVAARARRQLNMQPPVDTAVVVLQR